MKTSENARGVAEREPTCFHLYNMRLDFCSLHTLWDVGEYISNNTGHFSPGSKTKFSTKMEITEASNFRVDQNGILSAELVVDCHMQTICFDLKRVFKNKISESRCQPLFSFEEQGEIPSN
jgi:hypothetical protein